VRRPVRLAVAGALVTALASCDDALDQRLAIVDEPRVLAVVAEPAEAKPGTAVAFRALVAGPTGPIADAPRWAYCLAPKPPTEDNAVSVGCVTGDELADLGSAPAVTAPLPVDGCLLFGPDTPPGGFRPRNPDGTGGYYQPMRAEVGELLAFGLARITCLLPTAPAEVARDYALRYVANANPTLAPLALGPVPPGADVTLTAAWPATAAETYLYYEQGSQTLIDRRESMRVSWFATAGAIDVDAGTVGEGDPATSISTTWHAPTERGTVWVWLVLRDSRGGIATAEAQVRVE
jgi:hypothetical protein